MDIILVTGASSGMGREFCKLLDSQNANEIWGVALDEEGLNQTQKMLNTKFKGINLDLTKEDSFVILKEMLNKENANITWLVNAAGFGKFGRYDEIEMNSKLSMIDLNCKALVHLTEMCLDYMKEGARIVEFGSVAGLQPVPYINVYASTKAFVISYSKSLNTELKSRKISVTCVCPFWTNTAFFKRATNINNKTDVNPITKYVVMYNPIKVVNKAYKDSLKRKLTSTYGFYANFQSLLVKIFPHKFVMKVWCNQQKFDKKYKN